MSHKTHRFYIRDSNFGGWYSEDAKTADVAKRKLKQRIPLLRIKDMEVQSDIIVRHERKDMMPSRDMGWDKD